jgi:hypothetical protein
MTTSNRSQLVLSERVNISVKLQTPTWEAGFGTNLGRARVLLAEVPCGVPKSLKQMSG